MKKFICLCALLGFSYVALAQLKDSKLHYYIPVGGNPKSSSITVLLFKNKVLYKMETDSKWLRKKHKIINIKRYIQQIGAPQALTFQYNAELSTSARTTYGIDNGSSTYRGITIKNDKSDFKEFYISKGGKVTAYPDDSLYWEEIPEATILTEKTDTGFFHE